MPLVDIGLLTKILGRLGSTHDGEVLSAAKLASDMLKKAGLAWSDVVRLPEATAGYGYSSGGSHHWTQAGEGEPYVYSHVYSRPGEYGDALRRKQREREAKYAKYADDLGIDPVSSDKPAWNRNSAWTDHDFDQAQTSAEYHDYLDASQMSA